MHDPLDGVPYPTEIAPIRYTDHLIHDPHDPDLLGQIESALAAHDRLQAQRAHLETLGFEAEQIDAWAFELRTAFNRVGVARKSVDWNRTRKLLGSLLRCGLSTATIARLCETNRGRIVQSIAHCRDGEVGVAWRIRAEDAARHGVLTHEVAQVLGVPLDQVRSWLKTCGQHRTLREMGAYRKPNQETRAAAMSLMDDGLSNAEIARRLCASGHDVTRQMVGVWRRRNYEQVAA